MSWKQNPAAVYSTAPLGWLRMRWRLWRVLIFDPSSPAWRRKGGDDLKQELKGI